MTFQKFNVNPIKKKQYIFIVLLLCISSISTTAQKVLPVDAVSTGCERVHIEAKPEPQKPCCYKLFLTNKTLKIKQDLVKLTSIVVTVNNPNNVTSIFCPDQNFYQQSPSNSYPVALKTTITVRNGKFPQSVNKYFADICLDGNKKEGDWVYFTYYSDQKIICKDSVFLSAGCEKPSESTCCPFSLHFSSKSQTINQYKKIKVTALGNTKLVNSDPDEWYQTPNLPTSVEYHLNGQVLPFGEAVDNDFMLYLNQINTNHQLKVDCYNASNVIKSSFTITIPCNSNFDEDEDWTKYVTT